MREADLRGVIEAVRTQPDVNMAGFLTASTMRHALRMQSRDSGAQQQSTMRKADWEWAETPRLVGGVRLLPMLQWLDSTHVAKVSCAGRMPRDHMRPAALAIGLQATGLTR